VCVCVHRSRVRILRCPLPVPQTDVTSRAKVRDGNARVISLPSLLAHERRERMSSIIM